MNDPQTVDRRRSTALAYFVVGGAGLLVLAASCLACADVVHVTLQYGECDDRDLADVLSVNAEIRRSDGVGVRLCINTEGTLKSLTDLQDLLAVNVVFDDLPSGGSWTIWVQGFSAQGCAQLTLLCGKVSRLELPPADDQITVKVDCMSRLSTVKPEGIKNCY